LAGFLPSYSKGKRLENKLREARQENSLAHIRNLACLVYLQTSQNDDGLAAGTSTRLFDRIREVANQTPESSGRKDLEDLLSLRDPITALLAKGDPGSVDYAEALLVKTRRATAISSDALQSE
jgi:hypothetical protein